MERSINFEGGIAREVRCCGKSGVGNLRRQIKTRAVKRKKGKRMDGDERKKWLHKKAITSSRRSIRRERVMRPDNGGLVKRRAPPSNANASAAHVTSKTFIAVGASGC